MQLTELSPKYETSKPFFVDVVTLDGISKARVTFENLSLAYSLSALGPDETAAVENLKALLVLSYEQWPEGPLGEWVRVSDSGINLAKAAIRIAEESMDTCEVYKMPEAAEIWRKAGIEAVNELRRLEFLRNLIR